jgi:hypothetical protein
MNETNRKLIKATEAIAKNYGIKYCTKCSLTRPIEGGRIVPVVRGRTRWECSSCVAKKSMSRFASKGKQDAVPGVQSQDGVQSNQELQRSTDGV